MISVLRRNASVREWGDLWVGVVMHAWKFGRITRFQCRSYESLERSLQPLGSLRQLRNEVHGRLVR